MTVEQLETLLNTSIMIRAAADVIDSVIKKNSDNDSVLPIELTIENLGYQIEDLEKILNVLIETKL